MHPIVILFDFGSRSNFKNYKLDTDTSVNRVILVGNVGQDPRVKYFDVGSTVVTFPLATTDRGYTLANGTRVPERTEWHNIITSNHSAEIADRYVHKDDKLCLEGKIGTRSYSDQSGAMHYITEIYVDNMEILSPKGANPGAGASTSGQPAIGQQQQPVADQPRQTQQSQAQPVQDNPADDLPF